MGWLFMYGASRRDVIDHITRDQSNEEGVCRTLRKYFRGNTMYALHESGKHGEVRKWIGIYLLQRSVEGWGYKDMDESIGPFCYDCPLSYLEEADEPINENARKWREQVRLEAAKKPKVGETWALRGAVVPTVEILSVRPLRGRAAGGAVYRIKRSLLDHRVEGDS